MWAANKICNNFNKFLKSYILKRKREQAEFQTENMSNDDIYLDLDYT